MRRYQGTSLSPAKAPSKSPHNQRFSQWYALCAARDRLSASSTPVEKTLFSWLSAWAGMCLAYHGELLLRSFPRFLDSRSACALQSHVVLTHSTYTHHMYTQRVRTCTLHESARAFPPAFSRCLPWYLSVSLYLPLWFSLYLVRVAFLRLAFAVLSLPFLCRVSDCYAPIADKESLCLCPRKIRM